MHRPTIVNERHLQDEVARLKGLLNAYPANGIGSRRTAQVFLQLLLKDKEQALRTAREPKRVGKRFLF